MFQEDNTIYLFRDGKLLEQHYQIATKNKFQIMDFVLADDGNLYALLTHSDDMTNPAVVENLVEKIDLAGKQIFTQLPPIYRNDDVLAGS